MVDIHGRQRLLLGAGQARLAAAHVAIVGAGGTGSPTALMLAYAGVGTLHLIDSDVIVDSNLNRIYGATWEDVEQATHKVEVAKRTLGKLPGLTLHTHSLQVQDVPDIWESIDVVLGCVDNHRARDWLNELALLRGVPLIDVGCKGALRDDGTIHQLVADVRLVRRGGPCLYCYGAVTPEGLEWESLTPDERRARIADGYVTEPGAEHAIITMTTMGATVAVSQAIGMLTGQSTSWGPRVIVDSWGMPHIHPIPTPFCGVCGRSRPEVQNE